MKRIGCFFLCICLFLSIQITYANEVVEVASEFVYIYNTDQQKVIYEKKAQEKLYPASMTKIMTALVVLEQIADVQTKIVVPKEALAGLAEANASVAGFEVGEEVSVEDLLYGVMLPSGADATRILAIEICGSEEAFVDLMNEKATSLQLSNTHFVNTSGLHHDDHYSTANDIAVILQEALKNETFKKIFSSDFHTTMPSIQHPSGLHLVSTKVNSMMMTGMHNNILSGGKTGFTNEGGLCLASTVELEGSSYIIIVGNAGKDFMSGQHVKDTYALCDYLLSTFEKETVFKAGDVVGSAKVTLGSASEVQAVVSEDVEIFQRKQDAFTYEVILNKRFAPIEADEELGVLKLYLEGELDSEVKLYAQQAVGWNTLLIGCVCIGILSLFCGCCWYVKKKRRRCKRHR